MTKRREKGIALELREQGLSYSEIYAQMHEDGIPVSKGSLSNWLKDIELGMAEQATLRQSALERQKVSLKRAREAREPESEGLTGGFSC